MALRKQFETSLHKVETVYIDIFYVHAPDRSVSFTDTMREVSEMYKEGKFGKLGLNNYPAWEVAKIYYIAKEQGWVLPSIYQAMYNCFSACLPCDILGSELPRS